MRVNQFSQDCTGNDHPIINMGKHLNGVYEDQIPNRASVSNDQDHFCGSAAKDWRSISKSASG